MDRLALILLLLLHCPAAFTQTTPRSLEEFPLETTARNFEEFHLETTARNLENFPLETTARNLGGDDLCSSQTESTSLTYLVDTTGSMGDDLYQLKQVNRWILDRVTAHLPCGARQYTMVEFNDPYVGPVRVTRSKHEFGDFFNSLTANGGGDCPELAIRGLELALLNSPPKSLIMVLTDASALDYANTALVNNVRSLINSTESQIIFLITGLCGSTDSPDYTIYRDLASLSFGHVFQVPVYQLNEVFQYLDYALSVPVDSSVPVFSGDFTSLDHTESIHIDTNFSLLVITTDGNVYSVDIYGQASSSIDHILRKVWGFLLVVRKPSKGIWHINVVAGGSHSLRVEGITAFNNTSSCSKCHPDATCDDFFGTLQCSCNSGFIGDGFNCTDIDECAYPWTNNCTYYSFGICTNTIGSYTCSCPSGYRSTGYNCVDINECSSPGLNACHYLAVCINTEGNYTCACPSGYFGDGFNCQINECLTGVCGGGRDCIPTSGFPICSDPCSNYKVLNDTWRSTSNLSPSFINCDNMLNGWYRFVGPAGVRMPETCVSAYSCNTHAPIWMNGPHPSVSDGIVNRMACAHWGGSCCLWSKTIQVKACPAGYHVYKLDSTPNSYCYLSYCADATTAHTTCAADEEWKLGSRGYDCYCKEKYKIRGFADMVPEVDCGLNLMKASFHKCQMKALHFNINQDSIWDSSCYGFQEDNYTNTFSVLAPLQAGQCGVSVSQNSTHVTYQSHINISPDFSGGIIIRNENLNVTVSCVYALDMTTSLNLALHPVLDSVVINTGGTGQFKVSMALYNDSGYTNPYQGSEIRLSTKSMLYVGVFVEGGDTATYVLDMRNCYATPTNNSNDPLKYYIIRDSCPNAQDLTITAPENGVSRRGRFSVQMFKFVGNSLNSVYLHCAVRMCNKFTEVCAQSCSGISGRSSRVNDGLQYLSLGPITRSDPVTPAPAPAAALGLSSDVHSVRASWTPLVAALLLMSTMILQRLQCEI